MIGFNHAAVGGFFALALPLPFALPLAVMSHFVLDMLPHYGIPNEKRNQELFWRVFTILDFCIAWLFLGYIALSRQHYAVFFCGLAAASPDFFWVARVIRDRSFDLSNHSNNFTRWHASIQKYERRWGIWIELPLAIILGYLVYLYW